MLALIKILLTDHAYIFIYEMCLYNGFKKIGELRLLIL